MPISDTTNIQSMVRRKLASMISRLLEHVAHDRNILVKNHVGTISMIISFTSLCQCILEETLKTVSPLYLVSMPGKVKISHMGDNGVICHELHQS